MSLNNPADKGFLSSDAVLEEGLRSGNAGVWRWKLDSEDFEWSNGMEDLHTLPAGSFDGSLNAFKRAVHTADLDGLWFQITNSIQTGDRFSTVYRTAPRAETQTRWIEASGSVVATADGTRFLSGICIDVSARVHAEREFARRLEQQSAVASFAIFTLNEPEFQAILDRAVKVAADVLKVPLTKILRFGDFADHLLLSAGLGWKDGLVGNAMVGIERSSQAGYTLLSDDPVIVKDLTTETRFDGPQLLHDHAVRSGISVTIPGVDVRPFGVFGIHGRDVRIFDQTDAAFLQALAQIVSGAVRHKTSLERERLLVREMAHRAGNLLQLVTTIARQTFNTSGDIRAAQHSFSERLGALAKSNYIVSRGGWTATRFTELVTATFTAFGGRVKTKGRDILLPPDLSFDMGIVMHELATNSVKYGTLGKPEGSVMVSWGSTTGPKDTSLFCFTWEDHHTQGIDTSDRVGFGSILVKALVEQKWEGKIETFTEPHFCVKLEIPVKTGL